MRIVSTSVVIAESSSLLLPNGGMWHMAEETGTTYLQASIIERRCTIQRVLHRGSFVHTFVLCTVQESL